MRDVWARLGISGEVCGTNAARPAPFLLALACVGAVTAFINVMTRVHDAPHLRLIEPAIWEGSSLLTLLLFFWLPWLACRHIPAQPRWRLLWHVPVSLAFSLCHVGGFILLRKAAYLALGSRYEFGPLWQNLAYEYTKDALAYGLIVVSFALLAKPPERQTRPDIPSPPRPSGPQTFDIRDGAKLTRVMLDDILAVSSAGNYAEFKLRDGRLLCMRSSLSALEEELFPFGFVRTHRSWLVNAKAVTALTPEGSGDYAVELGSLKVPLSRRYPKALTVLRGE